MDILQELPVDQWLILQKKLRSLWPLNIAGYYALELNIKHPRVREAFQFKVYCPYGDMDNGFIATNVKESHVDCIIFSITEDTSKLEEALLKSTVIDWNTEICVNLVSSLVLRLVERVKSKMQMATFKVGRANMLYLDKSVKPFADVKCKSMSSAEEETPSDYQSTSASDIPAKRRSTKKFRGVYIKWSIIVTFCIHIFSLKH